MVSGKLLFKLYSKMSLCPYKIFLAHQRADKDVNLLRKYQLMLWALIITSLALTFMYQQLQSSDLNVQMTFSNYTKHHGINFIHHSSFILFYCSFLLMILCFEVMLHFFFNSTKAFFFFPRETGFALAALNGGQFLLLQGETQCLETFFDCPN